MKPRLAMIDGMWCCEGGGIFTVSRTAERAYEHWMFMVCASLRVQADANRSAYLS